MYKRQGQYCITRGDVRMIKSQNYILDFTHVYKDEDIEKIDDINWIDCSDIEGCDLYCSGLARCV